MDSQAQLHRNQAQQPIRIHHPEEEEHHEKGPTKVLKKVKEKAKKIKKALTKHGHGHEQDHGAQHIPDDHDLDEEDTEDYDHHQDKQIHGGAPKKTNIPVKKEEDLIPPGTKAFPVVSSSYASHGHESRPATLTPHNTPVSSTDDVTRQSKTTDPTDKVVRELGILAALGRNKGTSQDRHLPEKSHGYDNKSESRHDFDIKSGNDIPTRTQAEIQEPNQSSYTDKISSATSVLTEKAVAAKNVVASKLGYSGEGNETQTSSGAGYGSIVSEKLTPIYDKVKETGATVITKLPEKLSPGEEDKALSEVVTEKLHLGGDDTPKKGIVTQSEEVEKRLGGFSDQRSQEERKHGEAYAGEGEGGMVEKLRGAVTSWISGTTEEVVQKSTDSSAQSLGSTVGDIAAGKTHGGDNKGAVNLQDRFQDSGK